MTLKLKKQQKGFTIIEVLIVLAIAGLIMLIVFLAVPSLQRNSRNTQRKNDVAAVLGAVVEWSQNNGGRMPTTAAEQGAALANANLGIYAGAVSYNATATWPGVDAAMVAINQRCNGEAALIGQNRAVAVKYTVETGGGGTAAQCDES